MGTGMLKNFRVRNFKSIRDLSLYPKRINVFIGEPNVGKSNILEALGFLSFGAYGSFANLREFIRCENLSDLFYNRNVEEIVEIRLNSKTIELKFENGRFTGLYKGEEVKDIIRGEGKSTVEELNFVKFYRFNPKADLRRLKGGGFLIPPVGENLFALLTYDRELRRLINNLLEPFDLKLIYEPDEGSFRVILEKDELILLHYSLLSSTIQRTIFYLTAIESNEGSVLVFEEAESHAFPSYTKLLSERIALDKGNNQFFISTHNPYFLIPLIEKAPEGDLVVFLTYYRDYQTRVRALENKELMKLLETDPFELLKEKDDLC